MAITNQTGVSYNSSIDSLNGLLLDVCYDNSKSNLPILLVLHGLSGDRTNITTAIKERFAGEDVFVVVPDMRGRTTSPGTKDYGAREIYDIYDALQYVITNYSSYIDSLNINIVGYSGGGGNVLSAVTKFPDLFGVAVSYFGISDYGYDNPDGYYYTNSFTLLGNPASADTYRARQSLIGVKNNNQTRIRLYHDEDDTQVAVVNSQNWETEVGVQDFTNSIVDITNSSDNPRWIHGYPIVGTAAEPNIQSESTWLGEITSGSYKNINTPTTGSYNIVGYVKTKKFRIFLGDGTVDSAPLTFDISGQATSESNGKKFTINNNDTSNNLTAGFKLYDLRKGVTYNIKKTVGGSSSTTSASADSNGTLTFTSDLLSGSSYDFVIYESASSTMAIAYDAVGGGSFQSGTSYTFSHTCSTSENRILFVSVLLNKTTDGISGVTYAGSAMTLVDKALMNSTYYIYLYYILAPATGANNVVISSSVSGNIFGSSVSYVGVDQAAPDDFDKATTAGTSLSVTSTSTVDNSWMVSAAINQSSPLNISAGANTTARVLDTEFSYAGLVDSGGVIATAGNRTLAIASSSSQGLGMISAIFAPYIASTGNIKKINNIVWANVKKINNIAVANIKKVNNITA